MWVRCGGLRGSRCPCPGCGWLALQDLPLSEGWAPPSFLGIKQGPVLLVLWQRRVCKSRMALLSVPGSCEQRSLSAGEAVLYRSGCPGGRRGRELVRIQGSEKERHTCAYGFGFWQANHPLPFFSFSSLRTPRSSSPCLLGTGTFFTCLETAKRWGAALM